jgi:hypothetical protein
MQLFCLYYDVIDGTNNSYLSEPGMNRDAKPDVLRFPSMEGRAQSETLCPAAGSNNQRESRSDGSNLEIAL